MSRVGFWSLIVALVLLCGSLPGRASSLNVVTSIGPIHSLAARVMDGVGAPIPLLPAGAPPHHYTLKPAAARTLTRADLVVWVGPGLEGFLVRPLCSLAGDAVVVQWMAVAGMEIHRARHGGLWGDAAADTEHGDDDPHVWLDPANGIALVDALAAALGRLDPAHDTAYRANAARIRDGLRALDNRIAASLASVRTLPFMVHHDGFQYFEKRYGLNGRGALSIDPARKPGLKRMAAVRQALREDKIVCLFAEPQFDDALARAVIGKTGVRLGRLDPVGWDLAPGPDFYAALLSAFARDLRSCLRGD